jgi:hypothetical protein
LQCLFHITFGNKRKVAPRSVKQITHDGDSHSAIANFRSVIAVVEL